MTVRRQIGLVFTVAALWLVAGCGRGDGPPTAAEMDEPYYRQGEQLKRQGRTQEALTAFLKVIEKRGEQSSAESHLEAGLIFLNHSKDPIFAYYHFRQYLAQQPNSRDAPRVRDLINTAKRELLLTLPGHPQENQALLELRERSETLRRENDSLRAEIAALRGSAAAPVLRTTRAPTAGEPPLIRPLLPPPAPIMPVEEPSPISAAPAEHVAEPPAQTAPRGQPPGTRAAPARPTPAAPTGVAGRRHVVVEKDSLFALSKKYYGAGSMAKADAIYEANRDVMKHKGDLRPGMELKIP
jgi:tetratricopeptide (TPR) repeat protein